MNFVASIIVPLKNQVDAWLDQSVRSALCQRTPCQVLVVCSESTPKSNRNVLETLQGEYDNLRVLIEEKPGNFPAAINLGIQQAAADRIGLLLSDDWLSLEAVTECLPLDTDIVCTGQTTYYADGVTVHDEASQTLRMAEFEAQPTLEAKARYLEHFFLFRRAALVKAGGLDETLGNFPGIDDYELIWTLLEQGASVAIVEKRLYHYRDHSGERLTLADATQASQNLAKILRKHHIPEQDLPEMVRAHARWYGKPIYEALAELSRERPSCRTAGKLGLQSSNQA